MTAYLVLLELTVLPALQTVPLVLLDLTQLKEVKLVISVPLATINQALNVFNAVQAIILKATSLNVLFVNQELSQELEAPVVPPALLVPSCKTMSALNAQQDITVQLITRLLVHNALPDYTQILEAQAALSALLVITMTLPLMDAWSVRQTHSLLLTQLNVLHALLEQDR